MRHLITLLLFAGSLSAQAVYEDFQCYTAASAVDNGSSATVTCGGGQVHNFHTGVDHLWISGATGNWAGLNTQAWVQPLNEVSSTQTQFIVSETRRLTTAATNSIYNGRILWGAEMMTVTNVGADGLLTVVRGTDGTTAAPHLQDATPYLNGNNPVYWSVTATPTTTSFTVAFSCGGSCGPLTGTLEIRRITNPGDLQPSIRAYPGQSWSLTDQWTANGMVMYMPECPDQTDLNHCVHAVDPPENGLHYSAGFDQITSIVVDGSHNATISLSSPWITGSCPNCGPVGTGNPLAALGTGSLIFVRGMTESSCNTMDYMFSVTGTTGNPITAVTVSMPNVAPGTYTDAGGTDACMGSGTVSCPAKGSFGCLWLPPKSVPYVWMFGAHVSVTGDFMWNFNKAGSFPATANRMSTYVTPGGTTSSGSWPTGNAYNFQWGTYSQQFSGGGNGHYYHDLTLDTEAGQPTLMVMNSTPSIQVGTHGNDWPNDLTYQDWQVYTPPNTDPQTGNHYLAGMNSIYFNYDVHEIGDLTFAPIIWSEVDNEPDELVQGRAMYYSAATHQYHVYWRGPWLTPTITYEVRYSLSDLKTVGWNAGICQNGTTTCSSADRQTSTSYLGAQGLNTFLQLSAVNASPPSTIYWGIRPQAVGIMSTTGTGQNPSYIITDVDLMMSTGDHINTGSIPGNTAISNLTAQATTDVRKRVIWYLHLPDGGAGPSSYTIAGPLTNIICNGSSCTVNLTVAPNIFPGWVVGVFGTASGGPWTGGFDTDYQVTSVGTGCLTSTYCFTFASTASAGTYNTDYQGGGAYQMSVMAFPAVGVAIAGNGNYGSTLSNGGTVESAENTRNFAEMAFTPPASGAPTPSISPNSLLSGTIGTAYSQTLTASNFSGTVTWSLASGSLPGGLSGCTSGTGTTCTISGTPTTATGSPFSFTIHATDGTDSVDDPLSITVNPAVVSASPSSVVGGRMVGSGVH